MINPSIIAIDYTPAYEQGAGIGRLVRDLITALAQTDTTTDYRLFVAGASPAQLPSAPHDNFTWRSTRLTPKWLARLWHRAHLPLPINAFVGSVGLYHATDFVLPPALPNTKTIVTVHDLSFARVPNAASPRLKAYLDQVVPRSIQCATHVIADSQASKDDMMLLYQTPAEKITVLLSGISPHFHQIQNPVELMTIRKSYQIHARPYILSVGTVQPRKNYSRVIQALALLRQRGLDVGLVIAGGKGWLEDEMYQTLHETNMRDYVHLIGFAKDEDLPALYSGAACVAYPSLYEGFGFPILEGMACGTPVVTANISSLPEVAGDAALMVNDPYDVEEIAAQLQRALEDTALRETLIQRGFARVKQFTWERSARQLRAIYTAVLAK